MEVMSHSSAYLLPAIPGDSRTSFTYALVLLNQRLPRFTPLLWKHAQLRVCADGGANRVYDEMPLLFPDEDALDVRHRYKPDVIKGDMDSIRTEVLNFYISLGTEVVDESHDQDTTDLHKCVAYIRDFTPKLDKSNLCILVAGALGGRFDHEAGNINVLPALWTYSHRNAIWEYYNYRTSMGSLGHGDEIWWSSKHLKHGQRG